MSIADKKQKEQNVSVKKGEDKKMEIEIIRYKRIVELFNSPKALAKLIIVISLIIVLVFLGISIIALVVKSYYPYKTVNSNEYGATIIENEDNEVIYWLFNTADLWANSGIHVKKGDVISVRASGAFHSSIHHLVNEAKTNKMERKWVKPMGGPNQSPPTDREESRSSYRISPAHEFNTLLMQVIPENVELKDNDGNWSIDNACYLDGRKKDINNNQTIGNNRSIYPDIYVIGVERDKITIRSDGVLHFAVNDIALTRDIIMQMKEKVRIDTFQNKDTGSLKLGVFPIPSIKDTNAYKYLLRGLRDMELDSQEFFICTDKEKNKKYNDSLKKKYKDFDNKIESLYKRNDSLSKTDSDLFRHNYTELDYYLIRNFVDAWFVDNVGSYLIIIEREKQ